MKAGVFYGKGDLRVEERAIPQVKAGEVLIKVMACGICGTDVHIFNGDEGCSPTPPGTVLGHEFAGIVEKVGDGVTMAKVGDRVCVDPNKMCGECYYCKNG
ncbi:MAG: alcohol dehydrogenase catalytic domain-containing protein, partial [Clostridia bacterium]|nr:alcohol dehydrogenase catalytic domain-containing protein [Clostridia bacterium]